MNLLREQAEQFLEHLQPIQQVPQDSESLASTMRSNAQLTQTEAKHCFNLDLTLDDAGITTLGELLTALHKALRPSTLASWAGAKISKEHVNRVALSLGSVYGEILRLQSAGEWKLVSWQGRQVVALALTPKASVTPLDKVAKHFVNGEADSVGKFHAFNRLLARAANRANNMSPEERAAFMAKAAAEREARKYRSQQASEPES
jgi:hypothetical protein